MNRRSFNRLLRRVVVKVRRTEQRHCDDAERWMHLGEFYIQHGRWPNHWDRAMQACAVHGLIDKLECK